MKIESIAGLPVNANEHALIANKVIEEKNFSSLDIKDKLLLGNKIAVKQTAYDVKNFIRHPIKGSVNAVKGMYQGAKTIITNPKSVIDDIKHTYKQDKIDGIIKGTKVIVAVIALGSLTVGLGAVGIGLGSLCIGTAVANSSVPAIAAHSTSVVRPLSTMATTSAIVGTGAGSAGAVASSAGVVVTGASFVKNEYDIATAKNMKNLNKEGKELSGDIQQIAAYGASYGISKGVHYLAPKFKEPAYKMLDEAHIKTVIGRVFKEIPEFNEKTWKGLSLDKKMEYMTKAADVMGKEYGFKPLKMILPNDQYTIELPTLGYNTGKIIVIHPEMLKDPYRSINLVMHEQAHSYQKQILDSYDDSKGMFDVIKQKTNANYFHAKEWSNNWKHYTSASENYAKYKSQPLEKHAWNTGDTVENNLKTSYKNGKLGYSSDIKPV